jgi:hypothetical protein
MNPTAPADLLRINQMFDKVAPTLDSLAARWQDESEYEDINEYGEAIQKLLPEGFTLIKMSKRPFGFDFSLGTQARYGVRAGAKAISWKRLPDAKRAA